MTTKTTNQIMKELKVNRLPSLPHVLVEMLQACQENGATFQVMAQIISRDAAISSRVIALANSSFYSRNTEIKSIERALLVLGTDTIKTIVITAAVQQFFSGFKNAQAEFLKYFWKHSLSTALIAKSLAILTSYPNPDEAYLTGLLHNIGELVLDANYPESYCDIILEPAFQNDEALRNQKEQALFSADHAQIGAWLAKEWKLDSFAVDAIEFHHSGAKAIQDAHHLVKLIYLASQLANPQQASQNDMSTDLGYQLFELNSALIKEIVVKIEADVKEIAKTLGIDISNDNSSSSSPSDKDKQAQIKLAEQVRNIGLLQTASDELNNANSRDDLGQALKTTLDLLFGYIHCEIFWFDEPSNELQAHRDSDTDKPSLKFKLEEARSLLAKAAIDDAILCSLDEQLSDSYKASFPVVDQQISRLLQSSGFIACPIKSSENLYCVIAIGCDAALVESSHQARLLAYFSDEMALACRNTLEQLQASEQAVDSEVLVQRAREIAHEANNPLNIINNYLVSLSNKIIDTPGPYDQQELAEELSIVKEELARTSQIILRLRDLKQEAAETRSGVDINEEIRNLCTLYEHSLFVVHPTSYQLDLDPDLERIDTKRNQLKQIITNLIKNAAEATPGGGEIFITTSAKVNMNGQDGVGIVIRDQGPGIPADILKNLFKPVTSTKGDGHSGLGLSITKNLVRDAKGTISCRSNEKGTSFQLFFPHEK